MPFVRMQGCKVLLADDSQEDRFLTKRAMERQEVFRTVHESTEGRDVIHYLSGSGEYADRIKHPLPDLVLLDMHMPLHDGFEVLRWVNHSPLKGSVELIVFTASDHPAQMKLAMKLGALRCCRKPVDFDELRDWATELAAEWRDNGQFRQAACRSYLPVVF